MDNDKTKAILEKEINQNNNTDINLEPESYLNQDDKTPQKYDKTSNWTSISDMIAEMIDSICLV